MSDTHVEGSYKGLQDQIEKLAVDQTNIVTKFDVLTNDVEELKKVVTQFSDKLAALEEVAVDRRRLKAEIKVLKNRIDELYVIVKDSKEDESVSAEDPREVELP
ncbi:hypothetical protein MSG28_013998 [Choristoneura fumiferana]|uniref:Uncharacterized protein n=2 Tax=Choristoneura fumiferana TaxID=7141 RepID=A0ACC0K9U4_CHOFU|nr:hypothetical protein MSG28_013998 [Choristoneura fumiferana]KAI8433154.1 hypothetical protein MSG28_013998 [Choristoneura fumiferana]